MTSFTKFALLVAKSLRCPIMKMRQNVSQPPSSTAMARDSGWGYREVTWVCDSLEWTFQQRACQHGSADRSRSGVKSPPPAGYDMPLKVEHSLRNIIMMFVTADDSARVDDKRGASDF